MSRRLLLGIVVGLALLVVLLVLLFRQLQDNAAGVAVLLPANTSNNIPTVTSNSQWTPIFQDFNGVTMALVPPGCFTMGSTPEQIQAAVPKDEKGPVRQREAPATRICFDKPFWIDKTDVTQAQFGKFAGQAALSSLFLGNNRPVDRIGSSEAREFCALRGARLPTEAEWEYAARGPDNLIYPWGDTFDSSKAIWNRSNNQGTAEVGSIPAGASWVGALDMVGNLWQWTNTVYEPYPYNKSDGRENSSDPSSWFAVRGSSWFDPNQIDLRAAFRDRGIASLYSVQNGYIGFRCARSL